MNREEAKIILQSFRSNGRDVDDPFFAEALALAKMDAGLAAWFAEQQQFDGSAGREIKSLPVPPDLKAKILAQGNPQRRNIVEPPAAVWWRQLLSFNSPVSWAMATAVVVLLGLAIFWGQPKNNARFADYSAEMVSAAVHDTNHVDVLNNDMKQVVAWLGEHHGENKFVLPAALNGGSGLMGCRVLDWHGRKISMLCYQFNGSAHVDLFVAEANVFPDAPPVDRPQFASSDGMPTASWSHGGKVYLMVSHGDPAILEKILRPETTVTRRSPCGIAIELAGVSDFRENYLE